MSGSAPAARAHPSGAFPGMILAGAQSRLIPYDIPLRFFLAAAVFHVAAWVLLAFGHAEAAGHVGGPGAILAAVHALTLGVLAMSAMGASYQLLSVATGVVLKSFLPCRLSSWLYIPGTALLVAGMLLGAVPLMTAGGGLVAAGLAVFAGVVAVYFRRTRSFMTTVRYGWAALFCLAALVAAGLALIVDFDTGFLGAGMLPERMSLAGAHAVLGGYGFMGLLAMGFSHVLVPMFALSKQPDERLAGLSLGLYLAGLAVAVFGVLTADAGAVVVAGLIGLVGGGGYLWAMLGALRTGMKKRLGLSFVLVRASWVFLPLSIVAGVLVAAVGDGARFAGVFVFLLLFGWLLTFLIGVLQRILPFLASMHAHQMGHRVPRLSAMGQQDVTVRLHAICHGVAVVLVSAGMAADAGTPVLFGCLAGALGAAAFLWFAAGVGWHVVAYYWNEKTIEPS